MAWTSNFPERFGELVGEMTYREVGEKLNISKATVGAYLNGKREPKRPVLLSIAHAYGVDPVWLMGGDVPKYKDSFVGSFGLQPPPKYVQRPRLGSIACGAPILAEQNIECYDIVPEWAHCDFTLTCRGDSMIGARIFDGDVVCIHAQPNVENGEIAAIRVGDDEATLKRVHIYPDHIILSPENPNYRPQAFWDEDMLKGLILGKATYFISCVR